MSDILSALFKVLGISLAGLILAGWYSVGMLEVFSLRMRRFHDWAQLRFHARRVGLMAYKEAHSRAILGGSKAKRADDAPTLHGLGAAGEGLRPEFY